MPISPEQLDIIGRTYVDLFLDFENTIIQDMARRIAKMGTVTDTAAWQLQRLSESGSIYKKVMAELATLTGKTEKELRKLFSKAGVSALRFDDSVYKAVGLKPLPLNMSPSMVRVLEAGLQKTNGIVENFVRTTAFKSQQQFIKATDIAYMQVSSGAMSYEQALRSAVKGFSSSGIGIIYPSGRADKLDVAVLRAVRTGVSQTGNTLQMERAKEMEVDLVQVSSHAGARPSHAAWQGKIFSLSGKSSKYPKFEEATGYGTGDGLGGWNCRHTYYPYLPQLVNADDNPYDKAIHQDQDKRTVKYNGQTISVYEATQKQRELERTIRKWKRERDALNAAGLDSSMETNKVLQYQGMLRDFVSQTNLQRQRFREQV